MSDIIDIPVVIVGGGSCGLNLSIYLSNHGIEHVLFERHKGTSTLPKAHIINQRSMEIFRQHGIATPILQQATPPRQMSLVAWQTSLAGNGRTDRKVLGTIETWGCMAGSERNITYQRDSPYLPTNLPLLRSEPIFRSLAWVRNPGKVLFDHAVTDFKDGGDHVLVNVTAGDGTESVYRAQYLVGADGGKTIGTKLGVQMEGVRGLRKVVSTHFKADLSKYWDDRVGLAHFCNPELGIAMRSGSVLPLGPTWGRFSEEWQIHFAIDVDEPVVPREGLEDRVRQLLKIPDLELEILSLSNWILERVLANKYQQGRVFVAGDSAHRHPPSTGLGLNAAVQDAHNLAWKLAYVIKNKASSSILNSYEVERRPIGRSNCDWALFTSQRHQVIAKAIGLQDGQTEANYAHIENMFDETSPIGRATHSYLQYVIDGQKVEFQAHDMDLGFVYHEGLLVNDNTSAPVPDPKRNQYVPTTRPGHRLPHTWLDDSGKSISIHDLVQPDGGFLLITDRDGAAWVDAARQAAKDLGIDVRTAQIIPPLGLPVAGEYVDVEKQWAAVKEIGTGGAILVRPDTIVCWRSFGPGSGQDVSQALRTLLGLPDRK
ncbi:FAD binding domain-containing protein [Ilyonectria sp. MPI-CAGE-AT-0026]|nr:FAD binding domain-containing protein [Ilyonectria sp. MPI-CAGE-AT-0026]